MQSSTLPAQTPDDGWLQCSPANYFPTPSKKGDRIRVLPFRGYRDTALARNLAASAAAPAKGR